MHSQKAGSSAEEQPSLVWKGRKRVRPGIGRSILPHPHNPDVPSPHCAALSDTLGLKCNSATVQGDRQCQSLGLTKSPSRRTPLQHVTTQQGEAAGQQQHIRAAHHSHEDDYDVGPERESPDHQQHARGRAQQLSDNPAADARQPGPAWQKSARARKLREEACSGQDSEPESKGAGDSSPAKAARARHRRRRHSHTCVPEPESPGASDASPAKAARARHRRRRQSDACVPKPESSGASDASPARARHGVTRLGSTGELGMQPGFTRRAGIRANCLADSSDDADDDNPLAARLPRTRKRPVRYIEMQMSQH